MTERRVAGSSECANGQGDRHLVSRIGGNPEPFFRNIGLAIGTREGFRR